MRRSDCRTAGQSDSRTARARQRHLSRRAGFSLIEIIAVMAIIAVMTGLIGYLLRGRGTESYGLQTAQNTIASLLTLARSEAAVRGTNAGFFVNTDADDPERYLRFVVVAVEDPANTWSAVTQGVTLPAGCYIVPDGGPPGGMTEAGTSWGGTRPVTSSALKEPLTGQTLSIGDSASWAGAVFTPRGTAANSGAVVVATGRAQPTTDSNPLVFTNPDNVRGVSISGYGQLIFRNSRDDLTSGSSPE